MKEDLPRRAALKSLASGAALAAASGIAARATHHERHTPLKGNIRHSVCKWCYKNHTLEELCRKANEIGMDAIDLLEVDDYSTLKRFGLTCAVTSGVPGGIRRGLNRLQHHDAIVEFFEYTLPLAKKNGSPNVICFSGDRDGMDDELGLERCAIGLKRIAPIAERHGVTVVMELLNSKRNHPDYMCDNSPWGVELCDRVGSERFKLLYDIYHMQIMEGDVIDTIREFHPYLAHYHTGGVPGRHEIDETQELYYPAIMQAIVETGYQGYVAQEFIPASDHPLESLESAVRICDV